MGTLFHNGSGGALSPNDSTFPKVVGITASLLGVSFITYCARIHGRVRPYINLGLDDLAISIAMVSKNSF
jgi:hypothetical protein